MNLRLISRRVKDSSPQVTEDIAKTQRVLENNGVEYEPQDIGEPDTEYLAYLRDMLPPVKDSVTGVVKSDTFSEILPHLDFPVDLNDTSKHKNDDGRSYSFEEEREEFTKVIVTDDYKIILFGGNAKLTLDVNYTVDAGSLDTAPYRDEDVVSSELELEEILGIWVFKEEEPVVYIEGLLSAEDLEALNAPEVEDFDNYVLLEDPVVKESTLKDIDDILSSYIGKAVYTADTEN